MHWTQFYHGNIAGVRTDVHSILQLGINEGVNQTNNMSDKPTVFRIIKINIFRLSHNSI